MQSRSRLRVQDDVNENSTLHPIARTQPALSIKAPISFERHLMPTVQAG